MAARAGKQKAGNQISVPYGLDGDPVAVATVQRIFREFTQLYAHATLSEVAKDLNTDEVATRRGAQWHASSIAYVLRNPAYAEHGVISQSTFEAAQGRLKQLRRGPPR